MCVGAQGGEKSLSESFVLCFEILFLSYLYKTEVEKDLLIQKCMH